MFKKHRKSVNRMLFNSRTNAILPSGCYYVGRKFHVVSSLNSIV